MNKTFLIGLLSGLLLCSTVLTAAASTVSPTANFTLRTFNSGPASGMDNIWGDGGFEGFLTNLEGAHVDRTYLEYNMSSFLQPVSNATLDFNLIGNPNDLISIGYYQANGIAELSDWSVPQTPFKTFNAGSGFYSIDITSLINSNIGKMNYLGLAFSIDSFPDQAFFDMSLAPVINHTPTPIPAAIWIFGSGIAGIAGLRRRKKNRV